MFVGEKGRKQLMLQKHTEQSYLQMKTAQRKAVPGFQNPATLLVLMIRFKFFEMHWITHRQNSRISLGRKQHYAACMPVKLFSRSDSPPDSKILFPSTEQTTSLPASLALSENEKPPKQKLFCDCGQHPHDTGLLFANFQGILRSASWSTSQPIFFLSNSSGLWGLIGGARDRFKQPRLELESC